MSKKPKKSARLKVIIPGAELDEVLGSRGENMSETEGKTKSVLDKKREEIANLELDLEVIGLEGRINRQRSDEPASDAPQDSREDKLFDKVVTPLVNREIGSASCWERV